MSLISDGVRLYRSKGAVQFGRGVVQYTSELIDDLLSFVRLEKLAKPADLSWPQKLWLWRRGFITHSYPLYELDVNDHRDYLPHWKQRRIVGKINGPAKEVHNNKLLFSHALSEYSEYLPTIFGTIKNGRYEPVGENNIADIEEILTRHSRLVIKPIDGEMGNDIHVLSSEAGTVTRNGKPIGDTDIDRFVSDSTPYLVTEFVEQAPYADRIYPDSPNSVRLLTMTDPDTGDPFIAKAVHRFGTSDSAPVDNWSQDGLCADIEIETGKLGKAAQWDPKPPLTRYSEHPDTGARIEGATIANWDQIRATILDIADTLSYTPYVGWDVIPTEHSFKIIEGNAQPGIDITQLFGGLLEDERRRQFYQHYE